MISLTTNLASITLHDDVHGWNKGQWLSVAKMNSGFTSGDLKKTPRDPLKNEINPRLTCWAASAGPASHWHRVWKGLSCVFCCGEGRPGFEGVPLLSFYFLVDSQWLGLSHVERWLPESSWKQQQQQQQLCEGSVWWSVWARPLAVCPSAGCPSVRPSAASPAIVTSFVATISCWSVIVGWIEVIKRRRHCRHPLYCGLISAPKAPESWTSAHCSPPSPPPSSICPLFSARLLLFLHLRLIFWKPNCSWREIVWANGFSPEDLNVLNDLFRMNMIRLNPGLLRKSVSVL